MSDVQSFRVAGATTDILTIDVHNVNGQSVVYWEDIEQVYPGVSHIRNGHAAVSLLRGADHTR